MNFITELKRRNLNRALSFSYWEKVPEGWMRAFKPMLDISPKMGLNS